MFPDSYIEISRPKIECSKLCLTEVDKKFESPDPSYWKYPPNNNPGSPEI